jgi:OmpA-OmpF porin, OOP family
VAIGESGKLESSLTPGGYVLMVRADGFVPSTFPVTVYEAKTASFNPVLQPAKVVITKEKLEIKDKVFFESGKAIIKPESFKLLDEIALVLLDHPEIVMVRIEGHTDSKGADADNLKLSQARAESVRTYFSDKGVELSRMSAVGFGETRPIDPGTTAVALEKNRRVEFYIEKWAQ